MKVVWHLNPHTSTDLHGAGPNNERTSRKPAHFVEQDSFVREYFEEAQDSSLIKFEHYENFAGEIKFITSGLVLARGAER